jgi:tetratricopeptide (TPR) repeat protein
LEAAIAGKGGARGNREKAMSGEEHYSSSEFQRQQRSDGAQAAAQAPRRISTTGRPSPSRRPLPTTTTSAMDQQGTPSPNRRASASPYHHRELTADDSFADERFMSRSSWEEAPSFDSEEQRPKPSSRPHDRRKQFDTTTPTLIDEEEEDEDEAEMLQLQRSYDQGTDAEIRRTPGASMYKSTFEPSQDDFILANMRRTPGASAMHRSGPTVGVTSVDPVAAAVPVGASSAGAGNKPLGTSVGLGFGLTLSTPVPVGSDDTSSPGKAKEKHQRRIAWDSYQSSPRTSPDGAEATRPPLAPSTASPSRQPEPRGLFSFEPWARPQSPGTANPGSSSGGEGRLNSGTFSPNILRLTEDIGNLLQDDEDDDYALEIPSVFRGSGEISTSEVSGTDFDWTGSYVFDSERRKPAVPSRSAVGAEKSSRRRGAVEVRHHQQPSHQQGSGFLPNTQQPKPRRNEVFEFGKASRSTPSEERESPQQLLTFGGAFAPPVAGVNSGGFMRPVASFQGTESASSSNRHQHGTVSPLLPTTGHEMNRPRVASMPGYHLQNQQQHGSFQVGVSNLSGAGLREHSVSYDSYQSAKHAAGHVGGQYFHPDAYGSSSPAYGLSAPSASYTAQQSDMQATARVFIPQSTRIDAPQYQGQQPPQQQQWPPPQSAPGQQYDSSSEHGNWHSNASYNYGSSSFGYGMQSQQGFGDPRASMTPSPHLPSWQQPQALPQTVEPAGMYRGVPQQHSRVESAASAAYMTSTSPLPSMAGSEHSTTTAQRGGKKEQKRKQRGKKKSQKSEAPGGSGKKATVGLKKKSIKGEVPRPGSATQSLDGNDDPHASTSEDPIDAKRTELVESPATRIAFKEFYRAFRCEERLSFQKAEEFALSALEDESLPESVHWRVYLELADLAKRSNRYVEARCLYQKVCQLQPYASQGWLEYSKLEEECGRMNRVMNILHQGLNHCEYSENLLTRAVKHQEKMGNLANARGLLARLKHVGIEKVWRTVLEGALLEARAGNVATARRVLKYLMHHVPWYGPLYLEAYRLEKDQGHPLDALHVVERGLNAIPRYGPLWFGAFRLCEEMDLSANLYHLPSTMNMIERAAVNISKELVWKVHLDAAQMLERSALEQVSIDDPSFDARLAPARRRLAMTILTSPNNLRWKVWLAAARMELGFGNTERARSLFLRAHEVVPKKGRSSTLLELARLEDFVGETKLARAILCKGRVLYGHDWKVWLESVLLEIRGGRFLRAMEICDCSLEIHQGTGRLWATLVQLRQFYGRDEAQQVALRRALNAVPKSGEVWCEGGRIHLNPFSDTFDLDRARRHLYFATRFTPQYGDGFVETIRLELIKQWLSPLGSYIWETTKHAFQPGPVGAFEDGLTKYVTDVSLAISVASQTAPEKSFSRSKLPKLVHQDIVATVRKQLDPEVQQSSIDLNDVRLACVNADPNYGLLWFHCRRKATDTPRRIIEDAAGIIVEELRRYAHLYLAAMIRREAVLSTVDRKKPASLDDAIETSDPNAVKWEDYIDKKLQAAPSLEEIFNPTDPTTGMVLLESTASGPLFATGLTKLNQHQPIETMSLTDRRRALFGNDALFP